MTAQKKVHFVQKDWYIMLRTDESNISDVPTYKKTGCSGICTEAKHLGSRHLIHCKQIREHKVWDNNIF
jgi:hypothetical protein